jgi:hypothetical protein
MRNETHAGVEARDRQDEATRENADDGRVDHGDGPRTDGGRDRADLRAQLDDGRAATDDPLARHLLQEAREAVATEEFDVARWAAARPSTVT